MFARCLSALLCAAPLAASAAQVWVAPASQKIRPTVAAAPSSAATGAVLAGAKNEFESFQVVVTGAASAVTMKLTSLSDSAGNSIAGTDVVLYREALLNVAKASGGDGASGLWPDALVPDVDPLVGEKRNAFPFDVPANQSRVVFVDLHVPASAAAGVYSGTLVVSGGVSAQVPVQLTVWDFALPSTATMRSAFGLAWNTPCGGHFGDWSCADQTAAWALRARYLRTALDNRITIDTATMGAPVDPSGNASWSDYDAHVGPFLDGTAPTRLQGARLTAARIQTVSGVASTAAAKGWSLHFRQKGWFGALFNYACDEPPLTCAFNQIDGRIAQVKAADAAIPNLVTTTEQRAVQNNVKSISLYAPVINWMDDRPASGLYAGSQRGVYGGTVWWYQSCMSFGCAGVGDAYQGSYEIGWPSYAVDTDGTRNRSMEWLSFVYGMSGELYYETTQAYTTGDPWTNQAGFGGTGDGTLFYPGTPAKIGGTTHIPIESLRLKGIRDGMEDYELLVLARSLGEGAQALQIAQTLFPRTYLAATTPAAIDAARGQLAALILHALGKDLAPADAGTPDAGSAGGPVSTPDAGQADPGTSDAGTVATVPSTPDAGQADPGAPADAGAAVAAAPDAGASAPVTSPTPADPPSSTDTPVAVSGLGLGNSTSATSAGHAGCSTRGAGASWMALSALALCLALRRRPLVS